MSNYSPLSEEAVTPAGPLMASMFSSRAILMTRQSGYVEVSESGFCRFHYLSTGLTRRLMALRISRVIMKRRPDNGKCYAAISPYNTKLGDFEIYEME